MPPPPAPETAEAWDEVSAAYAAHVAPALMRPFAADLVGSLDLRPESEALEVAAGSGALTESLAPRVRSLLASDFSPRMVELLRDRM